MLTVSYSIPVRHLLALSTGQHRCILMLKAFFDESGHLKDPNEKVLSIGGCIAPLEAWESFEQEWGEALERFDVPAFHMKLFAHFRGPFEMWTETKRRDFLALLMEIMHRHITKCVGAVLPLSEYNNLTPEQKLVLPDPYFICFQDSLHGAGLTAAHLYEPQEKVQVVFAEHPEFGARAYELWLACKKELPVKDRLVSIAFASPNDVLPLQAADLVAYELNQLGHLMLDPKRVPVEELRWPMRQIHRKFPEFEYYTAARLAKRVLPLSGKPSD